MTWVKLDDQFFTHRKVINLSKDAKLFFLGAIAHSNANLLDGRLTITDVRVVHAVVDTSVKCVQELVDCGLLQCVDNVFTIHDYHDYNARSEVVRTERENAKERMRRVRSGKRSGERSEDVQANNSRTYDERAEDVQSPHPNPNPNPNPNPVLESTTPHRVSVSALAVSKKSGIPKHEPDAFAAFYAAYPRADDKADAAKAWDSVQPTGDDMLQISAALSRFNGKRLCRELAVHCKAPGAWIRARRWEATDPFPGLTIANNDNSVQAALSDAEGFRPGLKTSAQEIQDYRDRRDGRVTA